MYSISSALFSSGNVAITEVRISIRTWISDLGNIPIGLCIFSVKEAKSPAKETMYFKTGLCFAPISPINDRGSTE